MKIINVRSGNGKSIKYFFDIQVEQLNNQTFYDLAYFQKDNNAWVKFDTRITEENGQKKYFEKVPYPKQETNDSLKKQAKELLEKWIKENAQQQNNDFPF